MNVYFAHGDTSERLDRLFRRVSEAVETGGNGIETRDGEFILSCPMPPHWKRRMNHFATDLRVRISRPHGFVIELSETDGSCSGGFMGSCIPPSLLEAALTAWLASLQAAQLDLFGEPT